MRFWTFSDSEKENSNFFQVKIYFVSIIFLIQIQKISFPKNREIEKP